MQGSTMLILVVRRFVYEKLLSILNNISGSNYYKRQQLQNNSYTFLWNALIYIFKMVRA